MARIGVAFSGGGIRSASLCSGVLRRLLQKKVNIDYLSCVSGGGYTGTAYLDWKYRHGKKDDPEWHKQFFENMRKRSGIFCNWKKPCQGILDSIILSTMVIFVAFIIPILLWTSYACPLAFVVDFLFGRILRGGSKPCRKLAKRDPKISLKECELERHASPEVVNQQFILFAVPVAVAIVCGVVRGMIPKGKGFFNFLIMSCVVFFGLVFIPWFIDNFLAYIPNWMKILIILPTFIVWSSFPLMRKNATLMLVIYFYSFVIYWRVFNGRVLETEYDDEIFFMLLAISTLFLWSAPIIGTVQQRIGHVYNRWRIQRALYTSASVGCCGCAGISWRDLFLRCPKCPRSRPRGINISTALTLEDLDDVKPIYISGITINKWRRTNSPKEPDYELLMMTPHGIERLDRPPNEREFDGKLMPVDIYLSDAMATSAAAVDHHMGARESDDASFRDLKVILGVSMGTAIVSDERHEGKRNCCIQFLPLLVEVIRILPLVLCLIIFWHTDQRRYLAYGILSFFAILVLLTLTALVPTGGSKPGRLERIARWFTINIAYVSFVRKTIGMINQGPNPPPVLRLSDGGHIENLGILPLLKLRLKRIVSVNGGRTISDGDYGATLLAGLDMARKKLGCSFSAMDGRDIAEDIRDNFVEKPPGSQPSSYRFKVHYYDTNPNGDGKTKVGEGEILFIAPRHPNKTAQKKTFDSWGEVLRDIDVDLEAGHWGPGPELSAEEVDRLTFCCCECCHGNTCRGLSEWMCGAFPQHSTGNQFFTQAMFTSYHREGYRTCMEAEAAEFLLEGQRPESAATAFSSI